MKRKKDSRWWKRKSGNGLVKVQVGGRACERASTRAKARTREAGARVPKGVKEEHVHEQK